MPVLGAVGRLQFEVAIERMKTEFGVEVLVDETSWKLARRTDTAGAEAIRTGNLTEIRTRTDGVEFALFSSQFQVDRLEREHPEILLDRMV
jgi:peptide chain release factor 3